MLNNAVVSIITPFYNGEVFIHRLFESILIQTYPAVEMICVDDGSTDRTKDIIESFRARFEARGYTLRYIYQENLGQSEALKNGLRYFTGSYLTWPDSDDYYSSSEALAKMVSALQTSDETVSTVRCSAEILQEGSLARIGIFEHHNKHEIEANLFEQCLTVDPRFWFQPICYMAKSDIIRAKIPRLDIFATKHAGQNWQMMLPLFYQHRCSLIHETLCNILFRPLSHSYGTYRSFEEVSTRSEAYEATLMNTLSRMPDLPTAERRKFEKWIRGKYLLERFDRAAQYRRQKELQDIFSEIDSLEDVDLGAKRGLLALLNRVPLGIDAWWWCEKIIEFANRVRLWAARRMSILTLLAVLMLSLALNGLFYVIDIKPYLVKRSSDRVKILTASQISAESYSELVRNGARIRLLSENVVDNHLDFSGDLKRKIKSRLKHKDISVYEYGEHGILMWAILTASSQNEDSSLASIVKSKFDAAFLGANPVKIERVDQAIYGCVAIKLWEMKKEEKYKTFSDMVFANLEENDRKHGMILYSGSHTQQVDLLGFVCPFLAEYSRAFSSQSARALGAKILEEYIQYGVDEATGIPSQGYNVETKIKTGYSNWGRGMAWYALALAFANRDELSMLANKKIEAFVMTSQKLQLGGLYSQFPGRSEDIDMSATLPLLYFLRNEGKCLHSTEEIIKLISPYTMSNGLVGYNSPSISSGAPPIKDLPHDMSQGMLLLLINQGVKR